MGGWRGQFGNSVYAPVYVIQFSKIMKQILPAMFNADLIPEEDRQECLCHRHLEF
jgi:hypothetical protein